MNERVTIELDAEVLKRAREAGVDFLSLVLKKAVDRELHLRRSDEQRKAEADRWYQEHKEEVDSTTSLSLRTDCFLTIFGSSECHEGSILLRIFSTLADAACIPSLSFCSTITSLLLHR